MSVAVNSYCEDDFFKRCKKSKIKPEAHIGSYEFFTCRIKNKRKCFVVDREAEFPIYYQLNSFDYMQLVGISKRYESDI